MISSNEYLNKESILSRVRRVAANYFGVRQTELLDPIVRLFLESLAEEIFKIVGEIDDMESRILDKLSNMLIFDINTIAKPSHAVLHASSWDSKYQITTQTEFYTTVTGTKIKDKLSFYPVCNTRIYKGSISYFIYRGLCYSVDNQKTKTLLTRAGQRNTSKNNSFWIGLQLDESIKDIANMSFYIDFEGVYNKQIYLNQLPYSIWKIKDQTIPMYKGIFSVEDKYDNNTLELFSKYDFSNKINASVKNTYDSHYLSVKDEFNISDKLEVFPEALKSSFSTNFIEGFTQPIIWIEIDCPTGFTPEIIDSMQIYINAFPVANKKLVKRTIEVNSFIPIIPLNTGNNESFISVSSLIDSKGKQYYNIPVTDSNTSSYGIYSLRQGGCERYSIREARQYLVNIINSLNNEISTFFKNRSNTNSDLKLIQSQVNQIIKELTTTIANAKEKYDIENYILIDPSTADNDLFFLEYWITMGATASNIPSGTGFSVDSSIPINSASIISLSKTRDGKYAPQKGEKYNFYKQSLTRRNLLITNDDIIKFCMQEFCDSINNVHICRGLVENSDPQIGFVRTTDIYMESHKDLENYLGEQDQSYFQQILEENSPSTFRYRVFINKPLPN